MEPLLRGIIEKRLDHELSDETLRNYYNLLKPYKENAVINSIDSAMFGSLIANLINTLAFYKTILGQESTFEDSKELRNIVDTKSQTIKSRIREVTSR